MKKISKIEKVSMTYEELMNCLSVDTNRCGYLNMYEATKNGFSVADWERFVKRARKLKKIILKNGYSPASFFVLAKDEKGNIYLLDGQGRRMALKLLHDEDHKDFSTWEFICDLYVEPISKEEMGKLIIDLNTGNTNWQTKDIRRSNALNSDDPEVKDAYVYTKQLMDEYDLGDYIVNLFTYGEKASHQRSGGFSLSTRDFAITKETFTKAYLKFIVNASFKIGANGDMVERSSAAKKRLRNVDLAISFNTCLRRIVKQHNNNIEEAKEDIEYFVDRLLSYYSGSDAFVIQEAKLDKKDGEALAKKIGSFCRKASVREALYKTAI